MCQGGSIAPRKPLPGPCCRSRDGCTARSTWAGDLLHGDFHRHNCWRPDRATSPIDPKPMLGEPEYDVASFVWNPLRPRCGSTSPSGGWRRSQRPASRGRIRAWAVIRGAYLGADENDTAVLRALV